MSTFDYTQEERARDVTSEHYMKFYIETPIEDLTVTVGDEDSETVTVTGQITDPAGDAINESLVVRVVMFTDANFDTPDAAIANIDVTATTGVILKENFADIDLEVLTDDTGLFVLVWTDTDTQTESTFPLFILPNGKVIEGAEIAFAA